MGHEVVGCRAVPVLFVGCNADHVTGVDADEWSAAGLDEAFAFGDEERLAESVPVPGGVGTRREVHGAERPGRWSLVGGDGVDEHVAGEPVGGAFRGRVLCLDFHAFPFSRSRSAAF